MLQRFLYARDNEVDKGAVWWCVAGVGSHRACAAFRMVQETMKWRTEYRPDVRPPVLPFRGALTSWAQLIRPSDVATEAKPGKVYVHGHDRTGRPVVYMRMARDTDSSADEKLRFVVYTLERATLAMVRPASVHAAVRARRLTAEGMRRRLGWRRWCG
jgi:hypothetical protein